MGIFRKRTDPISDRARQLKGQMAELDAEIKRLNSKLESAPPQPRIRSTALPHQATNPPVVPPGTRAGDPIFEEVDVKRIQSGADNETTPAHYNDLGVRKYDLVAVWKRLREHFRGSPTTNPKLINYLAAGSIHGLRPLRYEKRVARNRFIAAFIFFWLVLWGIVAMLKR